MKRILLIGLAIVLSTPAQSQELTLKFVTNVGQDLGFDFASTRPSYNKRMDFEGDGLPELIVMRENDDGNTTGIRIVDPRENEIVHQIGEQEIVDNLGLAQLQVLAIHDLQDGTKAISILKHVPMATGAWCDSVWYHHLETGTDLGTFPPRNNGSAGKQIDTQIETLSTYAILDLDGDDVLDFVAHDTNKGIVEVWGTTAQTGVNTEPVIGHALTRLRQSYPNPFREDTVIPYEVQTAGAITLKLYDVLGREVRTLVQGEQPAGTHSIAWDGRDEAGMPVAAGTYFYQLQAGDDFVSTRQMIRVR